MLRYKTLFFALAFLFLPSLGNAATDTPAFRAGMNVLLYQRDFTNLEDLNWKLDLLFTRLVQDHVNSVSLSWLVQMDGVRANAVYRGKKTPSDEAIALFVEKAHKRGLSVMLRPIIDEQSIVADGKNEWRGTIRPTDVSAWFKSYTELLLQYADIAQTQRAESLIIAVELTSMEKYPEQWRTLIASTRKRYDGSLSYSSNLQASATMPWDTLDFIGVDAFFKLDTTGNDVTAEAMQHELEKAARRIDQSVKKFNLPVVFTEIGSASQKNAHTRTYVWDHKTGVDLEDQRRFYAASCAVWRDKIHGIYWWAADIWAPEHPQDDQTFTPINKPAEQEVVACYK